MASNPKTFLTPEEYLAIERQADYKSEYWNGEMFAMVGASRKHNLIATNVVIELGLQLKRKPCELYNNDICESVVEIGLGKSTTYGRHFSCGHKSDGISPLFSTPGFFNY